MRFIVDAQLPPALARWLATMGHEAEHVADGPRVIWVRLPNPRRCVILAAFERLLPVLLSALDRGETLIAVT